MSCPVFCFVWLSSVGWVQRGGLPDQRTTAANLSGIVGMCEDSCCFEWSVRLTFVSLLGISTTNLVECENAEAGDNPMV